MSGGFRVGASSSVPASIRKTIQNIKEIAGNHSDDEIYAMVKECSMDPNETAEKLLFQVWIQVAALVPKSELDGEMGDAHMAVQARLMSQALRKLSHSLSLSQTILIFINQEIYFWKYISNS
ncbi:DNA repair recA-like protein 3 [Nymphaea thermarum]|nr:DNA repair recA-like protein 3 [Nymphaea thermarum]